MVFATVRAMIVLKERGEQRPVEVTLLCYARPHPRITPGIDRSPVISGQCDPYRVNGFQYSLLFGNIECRQRVPVTDIQNAVADDLVCPMLLGAEVKWKTADHFKSVAGFCQTEHSAFFFV